MLEDDLVSCIVRTAVNYPDANVSILCFASRKQVMADRKEVTRFTRLYEVSWFQVDQIDCMLLTQNWKQAMKASQAEIEELLPEFQAMIQELE